jgi:hypothetical protein
MRLLVLPKSSAILLLLPELCCQPSRGPLCDQPCSIISVEGVPFTVVALRFGS